MSRAEELNATLRHLHPAAAHNLSTVGASLFYPLGIPAQSAEARGCAIDATIGQVTDGHGHAMALPAVAQAIADLEVSQATLYAPQGGRLDLRRAWQAHIQADAPSGPGPLTLPVATSGLTHGLCLVAALFARPGGTLLLPDPCWGNYVATFQRLFGASPRTWRLLRDRPEPGRALDLDAFRAALAGLTEPSTLLLNFPSNPLGYSPTADEASALVRAIEDSPVPLVVVCDDAYQGMVWEPDARGASLFHDLARLDPAQVLAVKIDGATKELFYFGGRVGFISFGAEGEAAAVLEDKARAAARATISSACATSQAVLAQALTAPDLAAQQQVVRDRLAGRYRTLKAELNQAGVRSLPFNGGMFAMVPVSGDPEALRKQLLVESVGVVSLPESGSLRLSYGSVARAEIPGLVRAIARHIA